MLWKRNCKKYCFPCFTIVFKLWYATETLIYYNSENYGTIPNIMET